MAAYSASLEDVKTAVLGLLVILQVGLCSSGRACQPGAPWNAALQGHVSGETRAVPGGRRWQPSVTRTPCPSAGAHEGCRASLCRDAPKLGLPPRPPPHQLSPPLPRWGGLLSVLALWLRGAFSSFVERYSSRTRELMHFKHVIQWIFQYLHRLVWPSLHHCNFRTSSFPRRDSTPISSPSPFPLSTLAPGNHQSTVCLVDLPAPDVS